MVLSYFKGLEDPRRPLIAPNYWLLKKVGMLPPKSKTLRAIRALFQPVLGMFVISQYMDLYLTITDIDEVLTNLKISMLSTVCVWKAFTLFIWEKDWEQILDYVTEADKLERDTKDEVRGKILDRYTKYCRRVTYFYWGLLFTTFSTTSCTPLMIYLSSKNFREGFHNGTELFPHVLKSWVPFDKYTFPGCWFTVAWQVFMCACGAAILSSYDSNIMVLLVFFGEKMELMREKCKEILGRDGKTVSDYEAARAIGEIHKAHILHMKHMKLLNSVLSPVMFMYMVMCSLMLCASTYQFTGLEDPRRPLIAPNYWLLKKVGMLPPKSKTLRAIRALFQPVLGMFVISQYMDLYLTITDIDEVLTNLKISMLSTVCVWKAFTLFIWEKDWEQILDYVTEADKLERDTKDEVRGKILDRYTKYCRRVTYFYWGLLFTTFSTTSCTPLMIYLSSKNFREGFHNGTELFPHVLKSWVPFDKYTFPGCWFTVAWQVFMCACGAAILSSYDSNIMVLLVFFGEKMELMREKCKEILGRDGKTVSDYEAARAIGEIHKAHILHVKHMKLLNSVLSPVMFMYMVMCSLMLCASTYQFTSSTNAVQKLLVAEYLIFGIAQLFIFCWHSNHVTIKNQRLSEGAFESQWWLANARQQKSILLLSGQLSLSHVFTAGPFTNLTLSTFILKGAYSYYTLIRK